MQRKSLKIIPALILVLLIPIIIAIGTFALDDKKYLFISVSIVILTIAAFIMSFENRKPKAREIVLISVLSALAVTGRMAFFMIPQFKPVMAIVIISGITLGAESGFLTGALAMFVSNFFFGQGSWTPWQMFAFGIAGFISGLIFFGRNIRKNRIVLCIYGGL
nr:ECF transporter S component [Clostridium sp.]